MRPFRSVWMLSFSFLVTPLLFAGSGVLLVETERELQGSQDKRTTRVHVEPNRVLVQSIGGEQHQGFMFLGNSNVIRMVDYNRKIYREMTRQDAERMGNQMTDAMSQMRERMREQLKNMPPEQRAMVEKMMQQKWGGMPGGATPNPQPQKTEYRKVSSGHTVEGKDWSCDQYEGYRGDEKKEEVCAADWAQFDIDPDEFQVFRQMTEFMERFLPQGSNEFLYMGTKDWQQRRGYPGIPVLRTTYENGQPQAKHQVEEISRQSFSDDLYSVEGFRKEEMPAMSVPPRQ